jgi:peptide/nickel transport system substrate-binding protein
MSRLWTMVGLLAVVAMVVSCAPAATPAPAETQGAPSAAETSAPASTAAPPASEVPQELTLNFRLGPEQLDPQIENSSSGQRALDSMFDKLVDLDAELNVVPQLAHDWEVSDDGLDYTFHLEEGVTFHDGTPFNAEAVKFTFERVLDPEFGSPFLGDYTMIDSIEVVDDSTVVFHLQYPHGPFVRRLGVGQASIISPTAVQKWGEDFGSHAVGTGPFMLEEYVPNERVVLLRNEGYWQGPPALEKVTFTFISEEQARISALLAGDTDFEETVPPSMVSMVEADPNMVIERGPTLMPEWFAFNTRVAPFDDPLVRKAFGYATDMDTIIEEVFVGVGVRSTQPVAPAVFGYNESIGPIPYDPDNARDLLAEAGWEDTDGDGLVDKDGQPLKVELLLMPLTEIQRMGEAVQSYLADVGVEMSIKVEDWGAFLGDVHVGNYQMCVLGQECPMGDADMTLMQCFHSDNVGEGGTNYFGYSSREFDNLIEQERREVDQEKRLDLMQQALGLLMDDMPLIPTFVRENVMGHNKNVKGFELHPGDTVLNLYTVYIEE